MSTNEKITMLHGAGGTVMHNLVKNYIVKYFGGLGNIAEVPLEAMDDAAVIGDIVFKSDSHAVKPIFFPRRRHRTLINLRHRKRYFSHGSRALRFGLRVYFRRRLAH